MTKDSHYFYTKDYTAKWPGLTLQKAKEVGDSIGVDWSLVDIGEFIQGIKEEQEHAGILGGEKTRVIDHLDYVGSGKIAYEHLLERPDYYTELEKMEEDGDEKFPDDTAKKAWVAEQRATNPLPA
jgi:hypothetical protein